MRCALSPPGKRAAPRHNGHDAAVSRWIFQPVGSCGDPGETLRAV